MTEAPFDDVEKKTIITAACMVFGQEATEMNVQFLDPHQCCLPQGIEIWKFDDGTFAVYTTVQTRYATYLDPPEYDSINEEVETSLAAAITNAFKRVIDLTVDGLTESDQLEKLYREEPGR